MVSFKVTKTEPIWSILTAIQVNPGGEMQCKRLATLCLTDWLHVNHQISLKQIKAKNKIQI